MKEKPPSDLVTIGLRIREIRMQRGLSLADMASRTGLSKGLLSKIENFRAVPSLPVLVTIARNLHVSMVELVGGIGEKDTPAYMLVRANEGPLIERDDAQGFGYRMLLSRQTGPALFEAFVLTVMPGAKRRRVTTSGEQFIFMLNGKVNFQLGRDTLELRTGDALFFNGRTSHVPLNPYEKPASLLALYFLDDDKDLV